MTKLQFRVLYRDFLDRVVDLEILSAHAQGDASTLLGQFVSLLVMVSVVLSVMAGIYSGARIPLQGVLLLAWSGEHTMIATTMLVVGLFAVLSWDSTFPDRRDVMVLAPLPVRARTMFLAKIAAVATALGLTVVMLHVLAGIAWPYALRKAIPANARTTLSYITEPALPPLEAPYIQALLDRELNDAGVLKTGFLAPGMNTGVSIGIVKHGVRRVFAYGTAQPDSLFEVGSISKTFTALILARMVAEGKTKLDEPVRELLPEGTVARPKPDVREITLLDLATHHSGLPRMPGNFRPADRDNPFADYHPADLYAYLERHGVVRPVDASFLYSNLGFGLLGQALADRAQTSYWDLLKAEITVPLGLNDTVVFLSPDQQRRFIQGHNGEHHPVHSWDLDGLAGAGAIRSTAGDMLTYLEAQLHPAKAGELAAAIQNSHQIRAEAGPGAGIGLSWFYNVPIPGSRCYWHGGATAGYTSDAFFNLKDDYAAVVLLNTGPNAIGFADWLSEHIRQRLAGQPAFSLTTVTVPAGGDFPTLIRVFAAYWITMFASAAFIFCFVLGMQGIAAQLLPRRLFLRVSSFLQLASFCLFVSVYFLQPQLAAPLTLVDAQGDTLLSWSPSYWFLGVFQQLIGSPALAPLARRAWIALGIAFCATAVAYALAYFRTLRQIVEEPDILPGSRGIRWLPAFGTSLQTAVAQFSLRTLLRSRQHRIILAFYLGIGFAAAIFFLKPAPTEPELAFVSAISPWRQASIPLLASSIIMLGFWIVGSRMVFSLPLDLGANWIFRITPVRGGRDCLDARRRTLWVVAFAPFWTAAAALFLTSWPWRQAVGHLAVLGLLGAAVLEVCLSGPQKIPFTCSWLPGKSNFHISFWLSIGLVILLVTKGAEYELQALQDPSRYPKMLLILTLAAIAARVRTTLLAKADEEPVQFEEVPVWHLVSLDLPRDGGLPVP